MLHDTLTNIANYNERERGDTAATANTHWAKMSSKQQLENSGNEKGIVFERFTDYSMFTNLLLI